MIRSSDDDDEEIRTVESAFAERIPATFAERGMIAVRWVLVAEVVGESPKSALWQMTSKDIGPWDTQGLLGHALEIERARTIGDVLGLDAD